MNRYKFTVVASSAFASVLCVVTFAYGHEIVGEVTPLMIHMQRVLILIENSKDESALDSAEKIFEDFEVPEGRTTEAGIKTNAVRVDKKYGFDLNVKIGASIRQGLTGELQKGLRQLSFMLMLEKFDVLEATFDDRINDPGVQRTIFWLGRNYFSYLLEPVMGKLNPIEEKRLDRLLDKMLYRLEDGEWKEFIEIRKELSEDISDFFKLSVPVRN